jgi:hypothetical protein
MDAKIVDIDSEEEILNRSDRCISAIDSGIQALVFDFGYHVKSTLLQDKIFDLRDNISYRLGSSRFHFHLLFNHLRGVVNKHQRLDYKGGIEESPEWHLEIDKRQLSYILDSIIFHVTSIFDYTAILVYYILSKKDDTPNWNKLESYCRAGSDVFAEKETFAVKEIIKIVHNDFVRHLYDYRSDIIHRTFDIIKAGYSWDVTTNQKTLFFTCSPMQKKQFKKLGDKNQQYSLLYFSQFVIFETIESIRKIIEALRIYMESNSKMTDIIKDGGLIMTYVDPITKEIKSPGIIYWQEFDRIFKSSNTR